MSMEQSKYSILMSVYKKDNPEWFDFAIRSMLKQTLFPDEFVIVEDGPVSDEIEAVVQANCRSYPDLFHIIRLKENLGLGEAYLAAQTMWCTRSITVKGYPLPGMLCPAIANAILVGWELSVYIGGGFWINALYVALGELAVLLVVGTVLFYALRARDLDKKLF